MAAVEPAKILQSASFDVCPFWAEVENMLTFVSQRLRFGQTDVEGAKMDNHISMAYGTLRSKVIKDENQSKQACRLIFWEDCKREFLRIWNVDTRSPKGSMGFEDLYRTLYAMQALVLSKPGEFWKTQLKPKEIPFSKDPPKSSKTTERDRSRSPRRKKPSEWICRLCNRSNYDYRKSCYWSCSGQRPDPKFDEKMGKAGIWQWKNPPGKPLYEGKGFWVFYKPPWWVCDTPDDASEFDQFTPRPGKVDGHFTMWIREKYAKQFPFLHEYDKRIGKEHGLLNRLDIQTSGPVIVCKDFDSWSRLKRVRDKHEWHKEYVCLVHGKIPVEQYEGVLDTWVEQALDSKTYVIDRRKPGNTKKAISAYQVQDYFLHQGLHYTLVKVRIVTGARHQIRIHMKYLLEVLIGSAAVGEKENFGLVSDYKYLPRKSSDWDLEHLCKRCFLHERRFAMWDPDDPNHLVVARSPLPDDLQSCLGKLTHNFSAQQQLIRYQTLQAETFDVQYFCQRFKLDVRLKNSFNSDFWRDRSNLRTAFFKLFSARFKDKDKVDKDGGLRGFNVDGDHSLLMEYLVSEFEQWWGHKKATPKAVEEAQRPGGCLFELFASIIDTRIWERSRVESGKSEKEAAKANETLPQGWRRMDRDGEIYYLHESGKREKRRPVPDKTLRAGWFKLATSVPNVFLYHHAATRKTKVTRPDESDDFEVPAGWERATSSGGDIYYVYLETGYSQRGFPCEGPPDETLLAGWAKVAPSKPGGRPFFFNHKTGVSQFHKPGTLPDGWTIVESSSQGLPYYFNEVTGKSTFTRPS